VGNPQRNGHNIHQFINPDQLSAPDLANAALNNGPKLNLSNKPHKYAVSNLLVYLFTYLLVD
jgi:hypothetical protein